MEQDLIMLWFSQTEGIGGRKTASVLSAFDSVSDIWEARYEDFSDIPFMSERNISDLIKNRDENLINNFAKKLASQGISYVTLLNEKYPALLKEIHDPPPVLYYIGELPPEERRRVSVVGSRHCSEYGLYVSEKISRELAAHDITVVSGMARGIDSSAHKGALAGGGKTIAVLGCGVDICYPPENRALYAKIIKNGCVMSESPPATQPLAGNFPARNRIISGLSEAVVVIEATEKSGSLITADMALEQGREVLAVPGNITSKLSLGTNKLIKEGACALASGCKDILNAIGHAETAGGKAAGSEKSELILEPLEKLVYDCINFEPISTAAIAVKANLPVITVTTLCTALEIKACIKKLPGLRYVRK